MLRFTVIHKIMKYLIIILFSTFAGAQVGIRTSNPSVAAALDINSERTTGFGGLKLPTVTNSQRDNDILLTAASEGTMLFVVYPNGDRCLEIYDGLQSVWQKINCLTLGPVILWEQNFDSNTTWGYASDVSFFNNGSDGFYGITTGIPSSSPDVVMDGNFLGIDDLDDEGNGTSGFATITFNTVAVSGSNLTLSFDYKIYEFDTDDDVYYTVTINGTPLPEVFFIDGFSNLSRSGTETIALPAGTTSVGFSIRIRQDGPDRAGFDNFRIIRN